MPRAIFPEQVIQGGPSRFRALPFPFRADLIEQGGEVVVENVPCAVWPASQGRVDRVGGMYDHDGEADLNFLEELVVENRTLVIEDQGSFKIVEAISQPMLPHITLKLRSVRPGG